MSARVLIDGQLGQSVSESDRGLAYGDGLFESIRFEAGRAPLWQRHMQRLRSGCQRLHLPMPDPERLHDEAEQVVGAEASAVVRITLTRGVGERGYALPAMPRISRIVAAFVPPLVPSVLYRDGVRLRSCALRLAEQPLLAGIKHLNRLEQVLARAEWNDSAVDEGLLCDNAGRVVSAIMANLFAVIDGRLLTPALDRCGVAGVARAEVLARCVDADVVDLSMADCLRAEELFLSSSVRGILPVQRIDDRLFVPGPRTRALQAHWRELGFVLEHA